MQSGLAEGAEVLSLEYYKPIILYDREMKPSQSVITCRGIVKDQWKNLF